MITLKKNIGIATTTAVILIIVVAALVGAGVYLAVKPPAEEEAFRIAMILPGRIDDMSWNQTAYKALQKIEGKHPEYEIAWVEGIYSPEKIIPTVRSYADRGYDLIICHGYQFKVPVDEIAPDYPNINFLVNAGWAPELANISVGDVHTGETGYIFGVLAARMSQTGKIGYISGLEVAELARYAAGYENGAKSVNPDIDIRVVYTGHFHDVAGAKETAISMAEAGVDVISAMGDGVTLGTIEGAKAAEIWYIGNGADTRTLAPVEHLVVGIYAWEAIIEEAIADIEAGTFGKKTYWGTLANGGLLITDYSPSVPEDVVSELESVKAAILAGEIVVGK